jgi:hypothetical protein
MRSFISLYLAIGIVLLLFGMFATGPCPGKETDALDKVVFVLGWPVYLYGDVIQGGLGAEQWLHDRACEGARRRT